MQDVAVAASFRGVQVPESPFLNATRIMRIKQERYERHEIAGALHAVRPSDRVLEMGAGLGIVGAVIAQEAQPEAILSFEANPNLIPHIRQLHALNGLESKIELRNEVVMSNPDRPERVDFFLQKSFLGSSLIKKPDRESTRVEVATTPFDAVCAAFRPSVLVLDIEGGEMDFLKHADLSGIRVIVIEFHPKVYGIKGMQECKAILRNAGFDKSDAVSTRFVWTAIRPDTQEETIGDKGSNALHLVEGAQVSPPQNNSLSSPSGVQDEDGKDVPEAALVRGTRRLNMPFICPGDLQDLPGTWLWGGIAFENFAHFITEGVARLWATSHVGSGDVDGLLFIPRRTIHSGDTPRFLRDTLAALRVNLPVRILTEPTRVERLVVPGQGFGIGDLSEGTPAFRAFMRRSFGAGIPPEGSERLYISRSALGSGKGALLGEKRIEAELAAQGYEIFHPEKHDFPTQIARYKAARDVIATEGSALHFLAHLGLSHQRVAVIFRRRSGATSNILTHLQAFTGNAPLAINALQTEWRRMQTSRARMSVGEPDLPRIQEALVRHGFIAPGPVWAALNERDAQDELKRQYRSGFVAA